MSHVWVFEPAFGHIYHCYITSWGFVKGVPTHIRQACTLAKGVGVVLTQAPAHKQ